MALNIKNAEVERLAAEVADLAGETKTEAIRRALAERRQRLALHARPKKRYTEFMRVLVSDIWPSIPTRVLGKRVTRREEDEILGYGPDGV